jgi:hypothetical protein
MKKSEGQRALMILGEFFPEKALGLLDYLKKHNKTRKAFPVWREVQLEKFIGQLAVNADEVKEAYLAQRIMRLAWSVRNLLEISIWATYCDQSQNNAERFHKDAAKDVIGWGKAIQAEFMMSGKGPYPHLDISIRGVADRFLAGAEDDDFTKVANAAATIGLKDKFATKNKILSKFAHPTAWSIASVLKGATKADEEVREIFLIDGVELATDALTRIRETIITKLPFDETER